MIKVLNEQREDLNKVIGNFEKNQIDTLELRNMIHEF